MTEKSKYDYLVEFDYKTHMKLIHESYQQEFNFYISLYNKCSVDERYQVGLAFYNKLESPSKRKSLYLSFLERQTNPNPKNYKNVLRFLNEMRIKTEFQSSSF